MGCLMYGSCVCVFGKKEGGGEESRNESGEERSGKTWQHLILRRRVLKPTYNTVYTSAARLLCPLEKPLQLSDCMGKSYRSLSCGKATPFVRQTKQGTSTLISKAELMSGSFYCSCAKAWDLLGGYKAQTVYTVWRLIFMSLAYSSPPYLIRTMEISLC